ncbi:MAG: SDR family NAD(P)-dependent oxidoreductase [Planctomycetales bacterium]|nr:SDR family NAD(P)-dependent oxidoreductase [Planctomycetales bacterium]
MARNYWTNKACLVTGASAGLGQAVATTLAQHGARVMLVARNAERLEATAAALRAAAAQTVVCPADVTWQEDVDRLAGVAQSELGGVDLVCHCAGRSTRGGLYDTTPEDVQQLFDVNCLSAIRLARAFVESLLERRGHLVLIGSLASKTALPYLGGYPASKHALAAVAQQLRLEFGPHGLHTLLACPGPIAREDAGVRYADQATGLPAAAAKPAGGAKLSAIDPVLLSEKILRACERRKAELIVPTTAKFLFAIAQLSPRCGDWILRKKTS